LELLRAQQGADACFLLITDTYSGEHLLYEAKSGVAPSRFGGARVGAELVTSTLALSPDAIVIYRRRRWRRVGGKGIAYDLMTLETRPVGEGPLTELANLLETNAFISLPMRVSKHALGRVYLTSSNPRFRRADIGFLVPAVDQTALLIRNTQLLERLILEAATNERKKISRDLHDGTIQPYIGLKLGLEALRRKREISDVIASEVDQLTKMAEDGISQLRRYVGRLRNGEFRNGHDLHLPAVRRHVERLTEFYGINVQVGGDGSVVVPGRLSNEVMHIVHEGLSNIRRHTLAEHAAVNLRESNGKLVVEIIQSDERINGHNGFVPFFPRSINERARELGGRVDVQQRRGGEIAVMVEIPV
jgi:signal transduction histidine kinase